MTNHDRIIKEVAAELGIPPKKVLEAVTSQLNLVRVSMQQDANVSIYLRKVGMFFSLPVRQSMTKLRKKNLITKIRAREAKQAEEPLTF